MNPAACFAIDLRPSEVTAGRGGPGNGVQVAQQISPGGQIQGQSVGALQSWMPAEIQITIKDKS